MSIYDPTLEAHVEAMLQALDHDADMTHGFVDHLRQLIVTISHILADTEGHEPTPEAEQAMRAGLAYMDARVGDAQLGYGDVLRRCLVAVERELFRWDSSMVQPAGFSGDIQIPVGGGQWEPHTTRLTDAAVLKREPTPAGSRRG
jgi:hypothetical protein